MSPEPKPSIREGSSKFWMFLSVVILAIVVLFLFRLHITVQRSLTPFEETVSDLFLVFLTFAFTWLLAKRDEDLNVLAKQKALARSALRRITGIGESAARLVNNLSQARRELASAPLWRELDQPRRRLLLEILNGLGRQLVEMRGTIDASAEDWGEILPEELAKIKRAQEQILQQEQHAFEAVASEVRRLQELVRDGQLKANELKHLVEERTATIEGKTRLEIERIRKEIRPFGLTGIGGLDAYSLPASGILIPPAKLMEGYVAAIKRGMTEPMIVASSTVGDSSTEPSEIEPAQP